MRSLGLMLVAAAVVLSGCGKSGGSDATTTTTTTTTAAPLTDADKQAMLAAMPAPYNTADLANGKTKFAVCSACHTLTQGGPNMTGPNLWGLFGRKAGSAAGYSYSDAVKTAGFNWDAAHLDKWLTDPKADLPGTKMTFPGLKDPKDRTDVIAYLKTETSPRP